MRIAQYGDWKIAVDIEKTKQYYSNYKKNDNQANRNFAEYCKTLSAEERQFFDTFAITPECCDIQHIGVSKKGDFPCGGYYLVCGTYLEYPPEELTSIEELAEKDFIDDRPDPRVTIGLFQFDFQCDKYVFKDIPENMPDGFICIQFWCEHMRWLLHEKPEEMMYEPPRFWEINKIIKERIESRKQQLLDAEESKHEFMTFFKNFNIQYYPMSKKETEEYKKQWVWAFSAAGVNLREIKKVCLDNRKFKSYLWHIFSFEFLKCQTGPNAKTAFDNENKSACVLISNCDDIAYKLRNSESISSELLEQFIDVTVTADDFSWTYSKTHEDMCGPYFYKK